MIDFIVFLKFLLLFFKHFEWCVLLALFNCNTVLHVLFWFDCGDGCVLMIFSFWWTCLFSICCFLCWTCVCYLSFFVLGHVSFVWLFAGYFWDLCVCYLSFLHLGMSVVCLLVHLGFCFRFLILGYCFVFVWTCSLMFFTCDNCFTWEMFLLLVWCFCVYLFLLEHVQV